MTRRLIVAVFTVLAVLPLQALAHEGHDHQVLGTVTMAAADHVMIKTKDGKVLRSARALSRRPSRTRT